MTSNWRMVNLTVNLIWVEEIARKFGTAPIRETLEIAIKKSMFYTQAEAIKETPVDQWWLRNAYDTEYSNLKGRLFNKKVYAWWVHDGTRPHFPPISSIEWWARRKGISPWAVARSISKRGTKANPFMDRTVEKVKSGVDKIFDQEIQTLISSKL